jgi:hypothetical protein
LKITRLSGGEVIELAKRARVIGVHERKWAFFRSGRGRLMLSPTTGPQCLYRGQTQRHTPCFPTIYRHLKRPARFLHQLTANEAMSIVADVARTFLYYSELDQHPVFRWAKSQRLDISELEIAQHYGVPSALLDLSESIEVALCFATHDYSEREGFQPRTSGSGVLYLVNRLHVPSAYAQRFRPVAIQPFLRPFRQWAWTCELLMGECFEAGPSIGCIEFEHSKALAEEIRGMAEAEGSLLPPDPLADLAGAVNALRTFPAHSVKSAASHLGPAYPEVRFGKILDALRRAGYSIVPKAEPIYQPDFWARRELCYRSEIRAWEEFAARRIERLCVRRRTDKRKPLQWGIDGQPTNRYSPPNPGGGEIALVS